MQWTMEGWDEQLLFYWTQFRSSTTLVTNSQVMLFRLDWCDPSEWICQFKTCWCCYCCWFWWGRERVGNSFVEILELKISRLGLSCWTSVKILKLKFGKNFEAEFWSRLWGWSLVEILSLKIGLHFEPEVWSKIWKLKFGPDSEFWPTCDMT